MFIVVIVLGVGGIVIYPLSDNCSGHEIEKRRNVEGNCSDQ